MAGKKDWDFECPQYYNFTSGLDNSGGDIYFDCEDPVKDEVFKNLHTPGNTANIKGLTEDAENELMDKMTAALSIIGNTPKLTTMKKKRSEHISSKNTCYRTAKKDMRNMLHAPAVKIPRSKSVIDLNKMTENENKERGLRKRSSSLNDLRTNRHKKNNFPVTPMCLKRTIMKSKAKVAAKTTEEMQLEEIARLQKQLIQHLRYNEMSLKKLKLKPRCYQNAKNIKIKDDNLKEMKVCEKGLNPLLARLDVAHKETRQNIHKINSEAVKNQAQKLNSIINRRKTKATEKVAKDNAWIKNPSVSSSSNVVSEASETNKGTSSKKPQNPKKFGFHSGLTFHDMKKVTVVKPFSFDPKIKETKNTGSGQNVDISLSSSVMDLNVKDDKENIPHCRVRPMSNFNLYRNARPGVSKFTESGEGIQRCMVNQVKGLSLSENIIRN